MNHLLPLFGKNSRPISHSSKQLIRHVSILSSLRENITAQRNSTRLGRGPSSGKGKTSSRGHKGQKARGKVKSWFEGGQTPIYKLFPKRGFTNNGRLDLEELNLGKLQDWIDSGRIDPTVPLTMRELYRSGVVGRIKDGVKLLADGKERFTHKIDISVTCASRAAIEAVEQLGGKYESRYYNQLGLKALVHPHLFERQPRFAMPTHRKQIAFYRDPENRGYLANEKPLTLPDWPPYKRRLNAAASDSDQQKAAKAASAHHALQEATGDTNHHRWGFTENKILSVDAFLKA